MTEDVINNNRCAARSMPRSAQLELGSQDAAVRLRRGRGLPNEPGAEVAPAAVDKALRARDATPGSSDTLGAACARIDLASTDRAHARSPPSSCSARSGEPRASRCCSDAAESADGEPSSRREVRAAARRRCAAVDRRSRWGERLGALFTGMSASASVLLLAALGLAITYGLMGVINMAHGELMMIGAYATYVVQNLFQRTCPGAFDCYLRRGDAGRVPRCRRWSARCSSAA